MGLNVQCAKMIQHRSMRYDSLPIPNHITYSCMFQCQWIKLTIYYYILFYYVFNSDLMCVNSIDIVCHAIFESDQYLKLFNQNVYA